MDVRSPFAQISAIVRASGRCARLLGVLAAAVASGSGVIPAHAIIDDTPPLVSSEWLNAHLANDDLVILDLRSPYVGSGKDDFVNGHIPGAVWSEYPGVWRSDIDGIEGLLPSVEKLEASLSELGVSEEKTVVLVSDGKSSQDFSGAARIYWTLKQLGQPSVAILDGGYKAWVGTPGMPVETGMVTPVGDMFIAEPNESMVEDANSIAEKLGAEVILLDGRPADHFSGAAKHSKAKRAGHLPGAVNLDQASFFNPETGRLLPRQKLIQIASGIALSTEDKIVSYCNTGHWAATNWFVLHELLGYSNVTLYDGSMVDWTSDPSHPIELSPDTEKKLGEAVATPKAPKS